MPVMPPPTRETSLRPGTCGVESQGRGRRRKAQLTAIEKESRAPQPSVETSPSGARPSQHAGPVKKTKLFSQHTFVHPLSPPVELSLSCRAFTVLLSTKPSHRTDCSVRRQEGGTGWTSLIRDSTEKLTSRM
ncbi:hypothetical protein IRJ41_025572, partial [Triplophysa rosa]